MSKEPKWVSICCKGEVQRNGLIATCISCNKICNVEMIYPDGLSNKATDLAEQITKQHELFTEEMKQARTEYATAIQSLKGMASKLDSAGKHLEQAISLTLDLRDEMIKPNFN